ncbi:transmembrane protein 225 isoform X1 [Myotis lucifugus]|uniref:transmembrane protein 225 isoform X1 n=1 Tax=Myotis lucifugus TaxID=59463 RepID=UPI0006D703C9|nr:transmembrane protein 225 isoform X1 [Myotis lucifugus]
MFSAHLSRRASDGGPAVRGPGPGPAAPGLTGNGEMEVIRVMLIIVLSLSYFYNFFLGLEFTYMIPQTACVIFMAVFLTCFTGVLLLTTLLLYHIKLRQGKSVYYSNYHLTWNISTAYISIFFHFASGLFSLLEYQRVMKNSASESTMENFGRDSDMRRQSGSSIQVISLPERSPILPSIVQVPSDPSKEDRLPKASQMQKRRVTWAM